MLYDPQAAAAAQESFAAERRSFILAFNPKSGKGGSEAKVQQLAAALRERRVEANCIDSVDGAIAASLEQHARRRLSAIVACGGDGTLNSILNGTPRDLPLAVYPCGTSNLMARRIHMPRNPASAAKVLTVGKQQRFDCGRVGERLFLLNLSAGFDAAIATGLESQRCGPVNRLSFVLPIFRAVRDYHFPQLKITVGRDGIARHAVGGRTEYVSRWCFIQNLPAYALLLNFTPRADGRDGLLDYCLFERPGFLNGLLFLYRVLLGKHRLLPDCHVGRSPWIRVETLDPEASVAVQLDGETAGTLPIEVDIVADRATFVVP